MSNELQRDESALAFFRRCWPLIAALSVVVGVVLFFWKSPAVASLFLGVGIGFCLWWFKDKADAAAMLAAAILGTPSEMICVKYGVWTYEAPGLIGGVPVWRLWRDLENRPDRRPLWRRKIRHPF